MEYIKSYKNYMDKKVGNIIDVKTRRQRLENIRVTVEEFNSLENLFNELLKFQENKKYIDVADFNNRINDFSLSSYGIEIKRKLKDFKNVLYSEDEELRYLGVVRSISVIEILELISEMLDRDKSNAYYRRMLCSIELDGYIPSKSELDNLFEAIKEDGFTNEHRAKRKLLERLIEENKDKGGKK